MRKITSLLMLCLMALGLTANAQTLDLTNSSNVYTVDSEKRGYLYYDATKSTTYILSTWLNSTTESLSHPKADGSQANNQFAFIQSTSTGKIYMYSVAAQKFLKQSSTNIVLTEEPEASVTLTANGTFYLIAFESGDEINLTNWDGNQQGIRVAGADPDGGNKMTITLVSTSVDLSAAIEKVNPAVTPEPEPEPEPGISTSKEYRIKHVNSGKYMNASNYDAHASGPVGGVQFVDKNESNDQIFTFVADGTNYKLKTKSGKYIYCQSWNVDALAEGTSLKFVDNGDGTYYIMNGDNYFKVEYVSGAYYPYCDASLSAAAKFELEEIPAAPDPIIITFDNSKAYLLHNPNGHGYLMYAPAKSEDNVWVSGEEGKSHANFEVQAVDKTSANFYWQIITHNDKTYLYNVGAQKFVTTGGPCKLVGTPTSINMTALADPNAYAFNTGTGDYGFMCASEHQAHYVSAPVQYWTSDDAGAKWVVEENETLVDFDNTTALVMIQNYEGALEAEAALAAYDGVGYPVDSERELLATAAANSKTDIKSAANLAALAAAAQSYATTANIKMPEEGKAYIFKSVMHTGEVSYFNCTVANGITIAANEAAATPFICKKINDNTFVFVTNDGKFMTWKGGKEGYNNNLGYTDSYDTSSYNWSHLIIEKLVPGDYTSGTAKDMFGLVAIKGRRNNNNKDMNYFVVKNASSFDQAAATFFKLHNGNNFSSGFQMIEVEYPNKPVVNDAAGVEGISSISTFCAPFATVVPNDVEVYIAASDESHYIKLQKVEGEAVPANTGVVLVSKNDALTGKALAMVPATTETLAEINAADNLLHADAAAGEYTVDAAVNAYVLGAVDGVAGFYPLSATDRTIKQGKAYLVLDSSLSAVKLYFGGDEATGIETVVKENANAPIFDLSGRRVVNVAKGGIYIQNGKKFIVK